MSEWAHQPVNETTKRRAILPCSPAGRSTLGSPLLPCLVVANGLFIASFILYLTTLAPSVVTLFDDSLEFQLVTYQLGIAHPTGYPLYTLLGKLFTLIIPVGNIAYRVNLMSAFFGAATVVVLYLLILQMAVPRNRGMEGWKDGRMEDSQSSNPPILQSSSLPIFQPSWSVHLGGIAGAVLLAVNPIFWQQATIAEVYTLNAFFVAILLFLATLIKNPGATHSQN
ncbi:MAG TPA: DUF2723 domain-containing protein, partial [Anaerolineae bacterium]|nr:DUF2723 domain-containing protein [Anaerolineae bacterium]